MKARSPSYPSIGLREAIDRISQVYSEDYQNPIPRDVVARHMGYQGLNGKSLGVLAALTKYGLLEGRGNENRVSDLAVRIIAHESGTPERAMAIREAARRPELFSELDQKFSDGRSSDAAIRSYLMTQKFIPAAADAALRAYRETKEVVNSDISLSSAELDGKENNISQENQVNTQKLVDSDPVAASSSASISGARRAVFDLAEGAVTLTFPERLSAESVEDLQDYIAVFLKRLRRDAASTGSEGG